MKEQTNGERFEEFMNSVQYPELEGTNALCDDIIKKRTGKMTEEEWLAAEKAQAKEEQKGILVELMELDSKDGLYESVTISSPQYIPEIPDEEIEKQSYIKFPILTYSVMEGHDDFNRHLRDSWVEGIKWYREQLKNLKLK